MRQPKLTTILLLVNLGLLGLVLYLGKLLSGVQSLDPEPLAVQNPRVKTRIVTVVETNGFHWGQLESEDYRTYIERLRAIGCPDQTIHDIIIADVDRLLAPQLHSLMPRRTELKYWHPEEQELWHNFDHRQWLNQQRRIDHEKREIIRELLGMDLVGERMYLLGQEDYYGRRLGFLSDDKRSLVRMIIEKYSEQEMALREKEWDEGQPLTAAEGEELRHIREARRAEIAAVLTPEERRQYELWLSPTANAVRNSTYGMNAGEKEFLAIFQLRKQFDEQWNWEAVDLTQPVAQKLWQEAHRRLDEEIRRELGDERYADYVRANDPDFRQLTATVARYDLASETAYEVYEYKQIVEMEREKLRSNYLLSQEQMRAALQEIAAETEAVVLELLGERAFNFYRQRGQGTWIDP
jgi:hypothetical protein